jgi:transketolase N-terminal domain/subunit
VFNRKTSAFGTSPGARIAARYTTASAAGLSKGHASTLPYGMFRAAGAISEDGLLSYRRFDRIVEGHPTPRIPWADVATGSLGQALQYAVGMALAAKRLDRLPFRAWVLCGDSEIAEGSQWEALEHATFMVTGGVLVAAVIVDALARPQRQAGGRPRVAGRAPPNRSLIALSLAPPSLRLGPA